MLGTEEMATILKSVIRGVDKASCPEAQSAEGSALWDSIAANIDQSDGAIDIPNEYPDMTGVVYHKMEY
jgi:hypothetical protein